MHPGPSRTSSVTEQHELKRSRHFVRQPDKARPRRTRQFQTGSFTPQLAEDETTELPCIAPRRQPVAVLEMVLKGMLKIFPSSSSNRDSTIE